jgi:hypothetical protein
MTIQQALMLKPIPVLIASVQGSVVDASGITTIDVPAHSNNDLIVAFGSNRTATPSPVPTDSVGGTWTSVVTFVSDPGGTTNDRSTRVAVCRSSGAARTVTFQGTGNGASGISYSGCLIWRNAVGTGAAVGVDDFSGTGVSVIAAPALSLQRPPSVVMVFTYAASIISGPAGFNITNGMAWSGPFLTSWGGGNFDLSGSLLPIICSVELF